MSRITPIKDKHLTPELEKNIAQHLYRLARLRKQTYFSICNNFVFLAVFEGQYNTVESKTTNPLENEQEYSTLELAKIAQIKRLQEHRSITQSISNAKAEEIMQNYQCTDSVKYFKHEFKVTDEFILIADEFTDSPLSNLSVKFKGIEGFKNYLMTDKKYKEANSIHSLTLSIFNLNLDHLSKQATVEYAHEKSELEAELGIEAPALCNACLIC